KLSAAGDQQWVRSYGGPLDDYGSSIALDAAGDIYAAGYFQDTIDFGGGMLGSVGGLDVYVAKLDPTGQHVWSKGFGGPNTDEGYRIAVDQAANTVYVAGYFQGPISFGGATFPA